MVRSALLDTLCRVGTLRSHELWRFLAATCGRQISVRLPSDDLRAISRGATCDIFFAFFLPMMRPISMTPVVGILFRHHNLSSPTLSRVV